MTRYSAALLDGIQYLPAIRSRSAELRGYRAVSEEARNALTPLISLGKMGRQNDPARIVENLREGIGTYFLDVNTINGQECAGWEQLCSDEDNYGNWRRFAEQAENAVPVALLHEGARQRPFIQQARAIEATYGVVVVRSKHSAADLPLLQSLIANIDDVNNLLVVLDLGYIRSAIDIKLSEARRMITALRTVDDATRIAVLSSSFPRAVAAYGEARGSLEILERELHAQLGGDDVAIYGDHASIYPEPFEPQISRFVPRIDYCTDSAWIYRRKRADDGGYVGCAREIVALPEWDAEFAEFCWGAGVILNTATSGQIPQGFGSPSNWIAARVNMHIERQLGVSALSGTDGWFDDDDQGEE